MKKILLVICASAIASGCAVHNEAQKSISANLDKANNLLVQKHQQSLSNVEKVNGIYLGDAPIKSKIRVLPALFSKKFEYSEPISDLNGLAEAITGKTGIFTHVTEDALQVGGPSDTTNAAQLPAAAVAPTPGLPPPPPPINNGSGAANSAFAVTVKKLSIQPYSGSISGFLDMATARFGVTWKFEDGQIVIYALDTRVFTIASVPGDIEISSRVGNAASGSNQQPGGNVSNTTQQSTVANTKLSPWVSIENNVRSMLSRSGRVVASPATNSLIVTDTPTHLDRVANYLEVENKKLSRRVDLYVKVYSVKTGKGENYGLDWNAIYKFVKDTTASGYPLAPGYSIAANTGNLSFKLSPNSTSPWAGSDLMLKALATQGDVSELTSAHLSPLNNRPAPIFVGRQVGYLARTTVSNTDAASSVSLEPGSISSGFTLNLLPSVLEKGRINLRYSMDIASLVALNAIKSGDQEIQVPDIDTRSLLLDTAVQSGETLVIAGFEQDSNSVKGSGFLSPRNILLGGSSQAQVGKDVLVVVITSYLVDR